MSYVSRKELQCAYYDCIRRKRGSDSAINFDCNDSYLLEELYKKLNTMTYTIGSSITFILYDENHKPRREVFAAEFVDRIVHHLIVNRIISKLEHNVYIDNSFSCRKDKGTLRGALKCKEHLFEASNGGTVEEMYIMKLDLKNCFNSFNKTKIFQIYKDFIAQYDDLNNEFNLWLLKMIIFHCPQDEGNYCMHGNPKLWKQLPPHKSLFNQDSNTGIAIGNLTSQVFCNTYLSQLDHYVVDVLGYKYYSRYVDDFYIIGYNKKKMLEDFLKICDFVESLDLQVNRNKFYFQHYKKGVKFVGYMCYYNRMYVKNTTKYNFFKLVYNWNRMIYENYTSQNKIIEIQRAEKIMQQWNSYCGLLGHVKGKKYIFEKVIKNNAFFVEIMKKLAYFDENYFLKFTKTTKQMLKMYWVNGCKVIEKDGEIYQIEPLEHT